MCSSSRQASEQDLKSSTQRRARRKGEPFFFLPPSGVANSVISVRRQELRGELGDLVVSAAPAMLEHDTSYFVVRALAWAAVIVAVFAPLAILRYRRS